VACQVAPDKSGSRAEMNGGASWDLAVAYRRCFRPQRPVSNRARRSLYSSASISPRAKRSSRV
jgi:hypothetical protein